MSSYLNGTGPSFAFTDVAGYYRLSIPITTADGPSTAELQFLFGRPQGAPGSSPPDPYIETTTDGDLNLIKVVKDGIEAQLGVTVDVFKVAAGADEEPVTF